MGLFKRIRGDNAGAKSDFIDLNEYTVERAESTPVDFYVKVAEIQRHDDIADLADEVYAGHVLIIDVKAVVKDEFQLRRVVNELKSVVADVGGDVAGIAEGLLCVTPKGVKVDRQKIRVTA